MKIVPALCSILLPLFLLARQSHVLAQDTIQEECERVAADDYQAEECLNLPQNSTIRAPSPVVLESTITNDKFICKDKPTLYTFSCTLYGDDLIWYFNSEKVTAFLPRELLVGRPFSRSYPPQAPIYNVTATLTLVSNETLSRYNTSFCVSIMTVQSFNESQADAPVAPFNVSCRTHCDNEQHTEVCQVKTYLVAETPTAPEGLTGTIQNISDDTGIAQTGAKAVSFINWSMPENNMDKTAIDYFEITLIGTHTNNTMSLHMIDQYSLQQAFSQKYVLSEGNYTSVSVTAVDLCGKRSKNIRVHLTNTTTASMTMCDSSSGASDAQQQNSVAAIVLGVLLLIFMVLAAALLVAVVILVCYRKDGHVQHYVGYNKQEDKAELKFKDDVS